MNFDTTCIIILICGMISMVIGIILCGYEIFRLGQMFIVVGGITSMVIVFGTTFYKIWLIEKGCEKSEL
jgi:membrane protein implicated in regulation of membrane protease activity